MFNFCTDVELVDDTAFVERTSKYTLVDDSRKTTIIKKCEHNRMIVYSVLHPR